MATELSVFSDYQQIYLKDAESTVELADHWAGDDTPLSAQLALAEDAVSVYTGVNDDVAVTVHSGPEPPAGDTAGYEHVLECSVRFGSGVLVLTSPTYGEDDGDRVDVPAGWLRLRIALRHVPHNDELPGPQEVRVDGWPAEPTPPVLLRGWDPVAGRAVP